MKLGLTLPLTDETPREQQIAAVQAAEQAGWDTAWVGEAYGWDAFTILTQMACVTRRIKLGTSIVNVFSRSPALIAQSAASLDAISGGRFVLGLGTSGHQVIEGWHGVPFQHSLRRLRESMEIIRLVLRRERLRYAGEVFQLDMGLKLMTHPLRSEIPIYLASITPAALTLAGEMADGLLPIFFSPRHFQAVYGQYLERGARRSGRNLSTLSICPLVAVVVTDDKAAGRDLVRPNLALYIGGMGSRQKNFYNDLWRQYGYAEEAARIQDLYLGHRPRDAAALITDEMVDLVCIIGPVEECRARLAELESVGVHEAAIGLQTTDRSPAAYLAAIRGLAG